MIWFFLFTGLWLTAFNPRSLGRALKSLLVSFNNVLSYLCPPQLTMNDFSVHRIIGRGGFGEVYGCRKADTGKMWGGENESCKGHVMLRPSVCNLCCVNVRYAMKCLDKKRIKMKQGETLALNERIMLSLVSTGVSCTQQEYIWSAMSEVQIIPDCKWQEEAVLNWNWHRMIFKYGRLELIQNQVDNEHWCSNCREIWDFFFFFF